MTIPQPTQKNAAEPDFRELLVAIGYEIKKQINCARVGNLQSFNAEKQTATVQIAQQQITSVSPTGDRTFSNFSLLVEVPVFILGGGGHSATFPFAEGDECLVVFNDREIDNWLMQGGVNSVPTTLRVHDLADGMCFIGFRSYPRSLAGYSTDSAQLRSDDGTTFVDVNASTQTVTLTAPVQVILNAPLTTIVGNMNVEGTAGADTATIDCNLIQTPGKTLAAGNGATGTFGTVNVVNGIVVSGS